MVSCLGIQSWKRLKVLEILKVEWIYYLRHSHSPQGGPEDTSFTMTVRNKFVQGVLESLKGSGGCSYP